MKFSENPGIEAQIQHLQANHHGREILTVLYKLSQEIQGAGPNNTKAMKFLATALFNENNGALVDEALEKWETWQLTLS